MASPSCEHRLVERAQIVLLAAAGKTDRAIADQLRVHRNTAAKWRARFLPRRTGRPESPVTAVLADAPRHGRPDRFSPAFWVDVLAVATKRPEDCGRPIPPLDP